MLSVYTRHYPPCTQKRTTDQRRKHERLIAFFWFCARMDWIAKNPAILLKRVKAEVTHTDYLLKEEFKAIVDATYAYGNWVGGHDYEHRRHGLRALVLLMRWSNWPSRMP